MIKEIPKSDIIVRPMRVYKEWSLDENDVPVYFASTGSGGEYDIETDPKTNGEISKRSLYYSIKSQFYRNADTASILYEVGLRHSYASKDERVIGNEIAVICVPQEYYGEGIKVGSVVLTDDLLGSTKVYTDDGYSNLIDSASNIKGNVFYDRGMVVMTDGIVTGSSFTSSFRLDFRSTKTIFENEIFLSVLENEFNYSQNPSAVYEDGGKKIQAIINRPGNTLPNDLVTSSFYDPGIKWVRGKKHPFTSSLNPNVFGSFDDYMYSGSVDPTGSYLAPYITTIALYDNELNMIAVAKLPKPIKSLPDYPLNFIVRFDT